MNSTARAIELALAALQQGQALAALEHFSQAIAADTGSGGGDGHWLAEAYRRRGTLYFDLGRSHEAITDLTEAIARNPDDVQARQTRALVRLALRNPAGALTDLEAAIAIAPDEPLSHQLLGVAQRRSTQIDGAIASFTRAARLYRDRGESEKGRQCLQQIDQLRPRPSANSPTEGTRQSVRSAIANAAPTPPMPTPQTFYRRAIERAEAGDAAGALSDLEWALQGGNLDPEALCCRGAIYSVLGQFQAALSDFNRALQTDEQSVMAYGGRGRARLRLGDLTGAIADLDRAIALDAQDAKLWITRGAAYRDLGNLDQAFADFEQAIALDASCGAAYLERGETHARLEDLTQAAADYQQAASRFCEQEQWDAYKAAIAKVAKLQSRSASATGRSGQAEGRSEQSHPDKAQLQQKLLRLVGGYWEIAERLLAQAREDQPNLTETEYLRQVIADIESDNLS